MNVSCGVSAAGAGINVFMAATLRNVSVTNAAAGDFSSGGAIYLQGTARVEGVVVRNASVGHNGYGGAFFFFLDAEVEGADIRGCSVGDVGVRCACEPSLQPTCIVARRVPSCVLLPHTASLGDLLTHFLSLSLSFALP